MKDYDNALEYLSIYDPPYMPMNEDEMAVVYGIGLCYLAKGIKDKAVEYLERVEARKRQIRQCVKNTCIHRGIGEFGRIR